MIRCLLLVLLAGGTSLVSNGIFVHSPAAVTVVSEQDNPFNPVTPGDWPLFGGTPSRNMVNLIDKNVPTEWSVEEGKEKNIKWKASSAPSPMAAQSSPAAVCSWPPTTQSPRSGQDRQHVGAHVL